MNLLLPVAMTAAMAISGMTHDAPEGHYNGHLGTLPPGYGKPHNHQPAFKEHPGCTPEMRLSDMVLIVDWDGEYRRMAYDEAERRRTNKNWADDVWVVGTCN